MVTGMDMDMDMDMDTDMDTGMDTGMVIMVMATMDITPMMK